VHAPIHSLLSGLTKYQFTQSTKFTVDIKSKGYDVDNYQKIPKSTFKHETESI